MFSRLFLKACNAIVNLVLVLSLVVAGAYAVYALWDNNQVLTAAEDVQADMIKLKPEITDTEEEDASASFDELQAINSDVCGWISMDNTKIDYPILHGENNLTYINKDVYGNFDLAGSIFLDSRNSRAFDESYALLYGHHMADSRMFGDLDNYKDEAFFRENRTGMLILPDKTYDLEIIACMLIGASDDMIFDPDAAQDDIQALLDHAEEKALFVNSDVMERARQTENLQLLALSTCSSEYTDARTIVLTVMNPHTASGTGGEKNG